VNVHVQDLWQRAKAALATARRDLPHDPDAAASRAYYAAFYAVSAYLASEGKVYRKHAAVGAAVHRELVGTGLWPKELGRAFSSLFEWRMLGDYAVGRHVPPDRAARAVDDAVAILHAVAGMCPDRFGGLEDEAV